MTAGYIRMAMGVVSDDFGDQSRGWSACADHDGLGRAPAACADHDGSGSTPAAGAEHDAIGRMPAAVPVRLRDAPKLAENGCGDGCLPVIVGEGRPPKTAGYIRMAMGVVSDAFGDQSRGWSVCADHDGSGSAPAACAEHDAIGRMPAAVPVRLRDAPRLAENGRGDGCFPVMVGAGRPPMTAGCIRMAIGVVGDAFGDQSRGWSVCADHDGSGSAPAARADHDEVRKMPAARADHDGSGSAPAARADQDGTARMRRIQGEVRELRIRQSKQCRIKVVPFRVMKVDQANFPGSQPGFQSFLTMDSGLDRVVPFEPHQMRQTVSLRELGTDAVLMLPHAPDKVRRHARVQRPVPPVRQDVNVTAMHSRNLRRQTLTTRYQTTTQGRE